MKKRLFKITSPEGEAFVLVENEQQLNEFTKGRNPLAWYATEFNFYDLTEEN